MGRWSDISWVVHPVYDRRKSLYGFNLAGVHRSTINDLENGSVRNPSPEILAKIAEHLDLTLADLYPLVGYSVPSGLPDFDGYIAAKFRGLPSEAIEEITGHLNYLAAKHGLDPTGPAPGEDER